MKNKIYQYVVNLTGDQIASKGSSRDLLFY